MTLADEISKRAREISTDQYPMSIGEIASIYKDGDLDIHPDFQRIYRWNLTQKSSLIESILVGIPLPQFFVAQNENGKWDVIDGLQRLSTIFEFMGILKNDKNELIKPLKLNATKFLPSLKNVYWNGEEGTLSLNDAQRRHIKRAKINITIIDNSTDEKAKYDLFQRLNTGGTQLSHQEMRNCLTVMINKNFYDDLVQLSQFPDFISCIPITEDKENEQYRMELVVRYLIARNAEKLDIKQYNDIHECLTNSLMALIKDDNYDKTQDFNDFKKTFSFLNSSLGENTFKKYMPEEQVFKGPFLLSAYETILLGLSLLDLTVLNDNKNQILDKIKNIYTNDDVYASQTKKGTRSLPRFILLTSHSVEVFKYEKKTSND